MKTKFFFLLFTAYALSMSTSRGGENQAQSSPDSNLNSQKNYEFLLHFFEGDSLKAAQYLSEFERGLPRLVLISLSKQELSLLEFAGSLEITLQTKISSGQQPGWTPTGTFIISKKRQARVSKKYGGVMTYWNCLTPDEAIGIHGLADTGYEQRLGQPVSHGCIRLGKNVEQLFYTLAPIGTMVVIE